MAENDKAQGKVEIKIGNVSFSAEGDQEWLTEQLSKVIEAAAPVMAATEGRSAQSESADAATIPPNAFGGSLASYLKAKGGESKQIQRFLATAGWLAHRGSKSLTSGMVAAALADNHQKRLANPADCLNKNCSKGLCEKQKDHHFFITPEGWGALGEQQ